jgi:hypothetical protein
MVCRSGDTDFVILVLRNVVVRARHERGAISQNGSCVCVCSCLYIMFLLGIVLRSNHPLSLPPSNCSASFLKFFLLNYHPPNTLRLDCGRKQFTQGSKWKHTGQPDCVTHSDLTTWGSMRSPIPQSSCVFGFSLPFIISHTIPHIIRPWMRVLINA